MVSQPPIVLGRYELHSAIANGGMASVHLGRVRGAAGFTRTVAIKRLHPHFARDASFVTMFKDEARLVARIQHPNVVPIVDVVAEADELFLVMEYVHGESLARLVHGGKGMGPAKPQPVPPAIAAKMFVDVLHGLHAAHEAKTEAGEPLGIVHRDVTPHNVLVGVDGNAKIADFGIAKATHRASQTQDGQLKGKLCYVAPEQLQGGLVGRAADVYAAAASLWEALTGRILFEAEHEARIVERVLVGATRPPSELAPGIPPELDEIVMRGLEIKAHRRFPTAREMALALERSTLLPPASEVGAWVEARAGSSLTARAALIAGIDRSGSAPPSPNRAPSVAFAPTVPASSAPGTATDLQAVPGVPRRGRGARVAAVLTVVLAVFGALWWTRARATTPAQPTTTPMPVVPDPSPAIPEPDLPSPVSPLHDPPAASRAPTRSGSARPPKSDPHPAPAPSSGPSSPADDCKPPYTRDETGRKIYKRECL